MEMILALKQKTLLLCKQRRDKGKIGGADLWPSLCLFRVSFELKVPLLVQNKI